MLRLLAILNVWLGVDFDFVPKRGKVVSLPASHTVEGIILRYRLQVPGGQRSEAVEGLTGPFNATGGTSVHYE